MAKPVQLEVKEVLAVESGGFQHVITTELVEGIPMVKINPQQVWLRKLWVARGSQDLSAPELTSAVTLAMQALRRSIHEARVRAGLADTAKLEDLVVRVNLAANLIGVGQSDSEEEDDELESKQPPSKKLRGQNSKIAPLQAHNSTVQYSAVQYAINICPAAQYSTVQSTVQYSTATEVQCGIQ